MKLKYRVLENQANKLLGITHKSKKKKKSKIKKQNSFFRIYTKASKALYAEYMRKMRED